MPTTNTPSQYLLMEQFQFWNDIPPYSENNPQTIGASANMTALGRGTLQKVRNSNPDWRLRVAKRIDASSAYKAEGWNKPVNNGWFSVTAFNKWDPYPMNVTKYRSTQKVGFPNVDMQRDATTDDQANARIKRKLAKRVGDMQLMAPVAELRELRSTISGTAQMVTDLVKSLIDIKRTKGKSAAKYAGDSWLNFGFGIAPTVADTINLCQSIQSFMDRKDRTERLTGSMKKDWKTSLAGKQSASISSIKLPYSWDIYHTYSVRYTAGFELLLKSANNYGLADHLHFEWEALVPVAWELMAWSWVYDYFTTVGAYLDDVFTSDPSKCLYCVKSELYTADVFGTVGARANDVYSYQKYWNTDIHDAQFAGQYYNFQRSVLTKLPDRALRFKTVDEMGKNAVNKLLNLSSVLVQGTGYKAYYRPFETSRVSFYDTQGATRRSETNRLLSRL